MKNERMISVLTIILMTLILTGCLKSSNNISGTWTGFATKTIKTINKDSILFGDEYVYSEHQIDSVIKFSQVKAAFWGSELDDTFRFVGLDKNFVGNYYLDKNHFELINFRSNENDLYTSIKDESIDSKVFTISINDLNIDDEDIQMINDSLFISFSLNKLFSTEESYKLSLKRN